MLRVDTVLRFFGRGEVASRVRVGVSLCLDNFREDGLYDFSLTQNVTKPVETKVKTKEFRTISKIRTNYSKAKIKQS